MSNNTFNGKRFLLLFKQHFIHNNKLLLFSTVAYIGVIFILLSIVQMGNDLVPHDLEEFRGFLIGFVAVFGILYTGYSFPAFRSKEASINYLMVPGSVLEKFLFELVSRVGLMLVLLPVLYWLTFHLQGYFFTMFARGEFSSVGFREFTTIEIPESVDNTFWFTILIVFASLLLFVLPFTGGAMFSKQPLVKTLFSVAIIIMSYSAFIYLVLVEMGVAKYNPSDKMWLTPGNESAAFQFFGTALIFANAIMLFVAYRKLKEREV